MRLEGEVGGEGRVTDYSVLISQNTTCGGHGDRTGPPAGAQKCVFGRVRVCVCSRVTCLKYVYVECVVF